MEEHETLAIKIKHMLTTVLNTNKYDSVSNYIQFRDEYVRSGMSFREFYKNYNPPIRSRKHTCVGLGLELIRRMRNLDSTFNGLSEATSLLSCEESVNASVRHYVTKAEGPHRFRYVSAEKEHVMVGVQIEIDGRPGVMIADPGYHVGKVVTVMNDGLSPHTGFFVQHNSDYMLKEYQYNVNKLNNDYVEWHEREIKNGKVKYQLSLVYTRRPYLSAVEVTEKRNLVYSFKSQLRRDPRGNVIAGYYFPLSEDIDTASFTVFIGPKAKAKYKFTDFVDQRKIPTRLVENFRVICGFMRCSYRLALNTICKLAKINANKYYMRNVIELNAEIRTVCKRHLASTGPTDRPATIDGSSAATHSTSGGHSETASCCNKATSCNNNNVGDAKCPCPNSKDE